MMNLGCNLSNIKAHVIGCDLIYGKATPCNKSSCQRAKWVLTVCPHIQTVF
nr:MAG TPA: hypothetical protein [Caudoviricetes sp.]